MRTVGSYKAGMIVWGLTVEKLERSFDLQRAHGVVRSIKIFNEG